MASPVSGFQSNTARSPQSNILTDRPRKMRCRRSERAQSVDATYGHWQGRYTRAADANSFATQQTQTNRLILTDLEPQIGVSTQDKETQTDQEIQACVSTLDRQTQTEAPHMIEQATQIDGQVQYEQLHIDEPGDKSPTSKRARRSLSPTSNRSRRSMSPSPSDSIFTGSSDSSISLFASESLTARFPSAPASAPISPLTNSPDLPFTPGENDAFDASSTHSSTSVATVTEKEQEDFFYEKFLPTLSPMPKSASLPALPVDPDAPFTPSPKSSSTKIEEEHLKNDECEPMETDSPACTPIMNQPNELEEIPGFGLNSWGQTCFFNATLQVLARHFSGSSVIDTLTDAPIPKDVHKQMAQNDLQDKLYFDFRSSLFDLCAALIDPKQTQGNINKLQETLLIHYRNLSCGCQRNIGNLIFTQLPERPGF